MIVNLIILLGLVKLLDVSDNPMLCAVLYAIATLVTALIFGNPLTATFLSALIAGAISFVYFWMLKRAGHAPAYWIVLIIGAFLMGWFL